MGGKNRNKGYEIMNDVGITRIEILSDWNDKRIKHARNVAPQADELYRTIFKKRGMPLAEGLETITCGPEEAQARYDLKEGIDVILRYASGGKLTLQEKYLTFKHSTMTFEEEKNSGKPGAWYTCTAQYWFTGYTRKYPASLEFQDWILVDFARLKMLDARGLIHWLYNHNKSHDSIALKRRARFRYIYFRDIPDECVIESKDTFKNNQLGLFD
jgi:hypothetical protein